MAKKKEMDLDKEEERLEALAKKAVESEEGWIIVRGGTKVILINEDDLKMEPIKKAKAKK